MIRQIISTTATRFLVAGISFLIVVANSRNIGAAGVGTIGIIILDITIITIISGFFGGPSFVYFTPRKRIKDLLSVSLMSVIPGPAVFLSIYYFLDRFSDYATVFAPQSYLIHIVLLAVLLVLHSNNMAIILGRQRIYAHNLITLLQQVTTVITLLVLFFVRNDYSVMAYLKAYYAGLIISMVPALVLVIGEMKNDDKTGKLSMSFLKEILAYGFTVQLASLFQIFNYRMPYYFLKSFFPAGNRLGVFTVSTQLAEGLWIIGKSISMVQYSRISNVNDRKINSDLTVNLLKFSVIITFILLIILLVLPVNFYIYVFGFSDFGQVKTVILYLSPGILALTANMILSHFLSGIGKPVYNLIVSFVGLVTIAVAGYYLVESMGLSGAAIAASVTYLVTASLSFYYYFKKSDSTLSDLIIRVDDFVFFKKIIKEITRK
jgi:O-antigen/teichoic acid export membrane protein